MKKVLRFLLILILILFVGYLILCATSPKEITVEKTTIIDAPATVVWSQIGHYEHWESWSPWKEADSTVKSTVSGPSGQVGNKYEWTSKNSGSGYMTITSVEGYSMKYDMHFTEPFESEADGYVSVEPTDEGTKTTWAFHTSVGFMQRGFFALMMTKQLEASFERGLELLKERIESGEAKMTFNIEETSFPATTFATVRGQLTMEEMEEFFSKAYEEIMEKAGDKVSGVPSTIYYGENEENGTMDIAPAIPVSAKVSGLENADVPESNCYLIRYKGAYSGLFPVYEQLEKHAEKQGKEVTWKLEQYVVTLPEETDSTQFVTNVYFLTQ